MAAILNGKIYWAPVILAGLGVMTVASAQTSGSPFASKKRVQAWETQAPAAPSPAPYQAPQPAPTYSPNTAASQSGGYSGALQNLPPAQPRSIAPAPSNAPVGANYNYVPSATPPAGYSPGYSAPSDNLAGARPSYAPKVAAQPADTGAYYPGRSQGIPAQSGSYGNPQPYSGQYNQANQYDQSGGYSQPYGQAQSPRQSQSYGGPYGQNPQPYPANRKRSGSWLDKLGLGSIKTTLTGYFRGGAAATRVNLGEAPAEWRDDYIADANVEAEVSAITQGGLEYGINLEARSQFDRYRRGFGGLVGDCPASVPGCASTGGDTPVPVRGHTSQFFTDGLNDDKEFEIALEGAYIFLRSSYGDVTVGWDDGSAYLFSLGAPSLLAVNASNSPVDYTGLDSVKTVNDASGFAEKVTYTSPRLLGDKIGIGVQLGASYAPNSRACGVDYCVRRNGEDGTGVLAPDLSDVIEFGAAIDRKFDNGLNVEATFTYATASEDSTLAVFDDLESWNTGLEVSFNDWTVGGSYLQSNNGLADGDYTAWDAGITWKPSRLGFTASYGHAEDENINLESDQGVFGISYEFDRFTLGAGAQYIERTVPRATGLTIGEDEEKATALFIEGGFTF